MKKLLVFLLAFCLMPSAYAKGQFSEYVSEAFESGIITGDENGVFDEEKTASRAEFAVLLTRFLNLRGGINVFSDVEEGIWFEDAFSAANYHGLLYGYQNKAMPYEKVTLQDVVTIIGRYYKAKLNDGAEYELAEYAKPYYVYADQNGIFTDGINKAPEHFATKGEILAILYNYDSICDQGVRFIADYPRIAQENKYGKIAIDIRTNRPCTIYYGLSESGISGYTEQEILCEVKRGGDLVRAEIDVDADKVYDIYFKASAEDGMVNKFATIENVRPFSIKIGNGTKQSPYIIRQKQDLLQITLNPAAYYSLGCDIQLDGVWEGIPEFSGTLDGKGFKISGMRFEKDREAVGLFNTITGGTVKNLTIDASVESKRTVGILAGINDGGSIENCIVTGEVTAKTSMAGGICGVNKGKIINSMAAPYFVTANSYAGGICGQNFGDIENCLAATDTVVSDMYAGGISGSNEGGRIENCVSACMTVYDSLTQNSGRIATNRKDGITRNNYFYKDAVTNAAYIEENEFSQNGYDIDWDSLEGTDFYETAVGWSAKDWSLSKDGFKLIHPSGTCEPKLEPGRTIYLPKAIETAEQLRSIDDNEAGHYILKRDITLRLPWKTICTRNGFSGTFDGNGHTIYNLNLKSETGLFSNITGGTVKNLTLRNVSASTGAGGAMLTACNYGYIRNCNIYGKITTKKTGFLGTVAAENYGEISGCMVYADIQNEYHNVTIGGICAENSGIVIGSSYRGSINSEGENVVIGGICGFANGGYVFESFSKADIVADGRIAYIGGICGMVSEGQIYKCSSVGKIVSEADRNIYVGGVCGMAENGVIYNSFSTSDIFATSNAGYSGGVTGFCIGTNVQNTYSAANVISVGDIITGGICGLVENGFVMQNVALNPAINAEEKAGAVVGGMAESEVSDNFACDKLLLNGTHIAGSDKNGIIKSFRQLQNMDFYFRPVANGGSLGWGNEKNGEDVWKEPDGSYKFPVLSGVDGQESIEMPIYK